MPTLAAIIIIYYSMVIPHESTLSTDILSTVLIASRPSTSVAHYTMDYPLLTLLPWPDFPLSDQNDLYF
jgi:hypothetical protein